MLIDNVDDGFSLVCVDDENFGEKVHERILGMMHPKDSRQTKSHSISVVILEWADRGGIFKWLLLSQNIFPILAKLSPRILVLLYIAYHPVCDTIAQ